MFCKNCGKELLSDEKYCSGCGKLVSLEQSSYTNDKITKKKKNKGKIIGIVPGIVLIIVLILFGLLIESSTKDVIHIEPILDVNKYYKSAGETISIDDLIQLNGTPEDKENWNYSVDEHKSIPLTTLYYNNSNYQYIFKDNKLIEIIITNPIKYNSTDDIFKILNLTKHEITKIENGGTYLKIYNSSVPLVWCILDNKMFTTIKITYDTTI